MRTAAAAAIVYVVAGGGWGVYSRVQPPSQPELSLLPPVAAHRRVLERECDADSAEPLNGPVLKHAGCPMLPQRTKPHATAGKKPVKNGDAEPYVPRLQPAKCQALPMHYSSRTRADDHAQNDKHHRAPECRNQSVDT